MKYKPKRDLPQFAREFQTLSPSKLTEVVLMRRNRRVTPESITMWFKRHPDVHNALVKELVENQPSRKEAIPEHIFQNGAFEELDSIKNWILEMEDRDIANILKCVNAIKRVCMGRFSHWKIDLVKEGLWCLKHPDRLTLDEAREIVRILKRKGHDTSTIRIPLRDFLLSKGIVVGKKITGAKSKGFGKFAKLYVSIETLNHMLAWIKSVDFEAYVIDKFMLKTGTRITATLKASIENLREFEGYSQVTVYDKGRRSIHPEGREWIKHVDADLLADLKIIIRERKSGKIFQKTDDEMSHINREALREFVPDLEPKIPMPNHFWRHMFFQHMLRLTDWNYGACAELGGSTVKSLEESYGKPPKAVVKSWGLKYMPMIKVETEDLSSEQTMPIQTVEQPFLDFWSRR